MLNADSPRAYRTCTRCVMDTTDPKMTFDTHGVCSHCHSYDEFVSKWNLPARIQSNEIEKVFADIKEQGQGKDYDCVMGLSGGVDSSYVALLAKEYGLRPLCVHLDNGWNSEIAVRNIHQIVKTCGFDLYTHVLDWEEFRDLQVSFFKAGVVDLELLTDHAIFGVILQLAKKHKIRRILSGANFSTEQVMPSSWVYRKSDLTNIRDIHAKFGKISLRTFPQVSTLAHVWGMYVRGYKVIKPLNYIQYHKADAKKKLVEVFGWKDYGGKHYESLFTKFYQAHILPTKFNIDKRKAHLSTLICSGQMTREEALKELERALYDPQDLKNDFDYVCKKLGFSREWMENYLSSPGHQHEDYATDQWIYDILRFVQRSVSK